jgi:hypothetical protein
VKKSTGKPNCADKQAGCHVGLPVGDVGRSKKTISGISDFNQNMVSVDQ